MYLYCKLYLGINNIIYVLGLNGQMVTDLDPVQYCVDDTKPDGSHPCIMGFIQARMARQLMALSPEER